MTPVEKAILLPRGFFFFPFRNWSKPESKSHTDILLHFLVLEHCRISIDASLSLNRNTTFCFKEALTRKTMLACGGTGLPMA